MASFLPRSYGYFTYSYSRRVVGGFLSATGHMVTLLIRIVGGLLVASFLPRSYGNFTHLYNQSYGNFTNLYSGRVVGGFLSAIGHMVTLLIRIAGGLLVASIW